MPLYRATAPIEGVVESTEIILCALSVAPPVPELRAFPEAGLKARFGELFKEKYSYDEMPWRHQDVPRWDRYIWTMSKPA